MNYLVWPEGRYINSVVRNEKDDVWDLGKKKFVPYKEEDREKYIIIALFIGGDLYRVPNPDARESVIVYEKQGPKPSKYDAVIAVFGEASFNYQDFCSNAKYSEKQKQRPYY